MTAVIDLPYSLVIEATADPHFFGFHSPDLAGFAGTGTSVADCLERAGGGMAEHVGLLREHGLPVPPPAADPVVTIRNEARPAAA